MQEGVAVDGHSLGDGVVTIHGDDLAMTQNQRCGCRHADLPLESL